MAGARRAPGKGPCRRRALAAAVEAATCPTFPPESFRVLEDPVTEWWLEVEVGDARGWLLVDPSVLIRREF